MKELYVEESDEKSVEQIPIHEIMSNIERVLAKKYKVSRLTIRKILKQYYTSMTKPSTEEIIEKYENGSRVKDLADEYRITRNAITARIKKYYEKNGKEHPRKRKILSEEEIKKIIEKYENGAEVENLADEYGVVAETIRKKIQGYYIQSGRKNPIAQNIAQNKVEETEEIISKWENGMTEQEIAVEQKKSTYFIKKTIKNHVNQTGAKIVRGATIVVDYLNKGLTPEQIIEVARKNNVIIPENIMQEAIKSVQDVEETRVKEKGREIVD